MAANAIMKIFKIQPARDKEIVIKEPLSYTGRVMRNRIWYYGEPSELSQFFKKYANDEISKSRFWATVPSAEYVRKMHSGIPSIIVERLADIVVSDIDKIGINGDEEEVNSIWTEISEDNKFNDLIGEAIIECLVTGDGAFKISIDTDDTLYPIIEFYSGERVDYLYNHDRLKEVYFFDAYEHGDKEYRLKHIYGRGYIDYKLYDNAGKEVDIGTLNETKNLEKTTYDSDFIWAVPLRFFKSPRYNNRGKSIFDAKTDSFDALDETISQWVDAIRDGRVNKYIPEDLLPRSEKTGELMSPNPFDNKFVAIKGNFAEDGNRNQVEVVQPAINYEAYVNTYLNNLDMCLQGIISPSSLGIDLKKTDNAESQREKEKATLHTRGKIVDKLSEVIPEVIKIALHVNDDLAGRPLSDYEIKIEFGEYANPSFETQIETVGKGRTQGSLSTEATVEVLWGDRKSEDWKEEEIKRLKSEQGIMEIEEPSVNTELGSFVANIEEVKPDESKSRKPNVLNEPS